MPKTLVLFLDLGDVFTKGLAVRADGRRRRLRFPSAVARRLIKPDGARTKPKDDLLLADHTLVPRPAGFQPAHHPRHRSYEGGDAFLRAAAGAPPDGALFVGWLAAAFGEDRRVLGRDPEPELVDALTKKALLCCLEDHDRAEVVFVVDVGAKADLIGAHARQLTGQLAMATRSFRRNAAEHIRLDVRGHVLDGAACAAAVFRRQAALPPASRRVLLVDVGYFRSKLAIVSETQGCELQVEHENLGVSDVVRRVLRDGQEQGLVEDELAVARALERGRRLEIAGRVFDVDRLVEEALHDLEQQLLGAGRSALMENYSRRGEVCGAVAVIGGGAPLAGDRLARRLLAEKVGIEASWVAKDASFTLLEGARAIWRSP